MTLPSLRRWHRWLGLAALVFLLVAALTGSLLVYQKALIRLLVAPDSSVPAGYDAGRMAGQLDAIVQRLHSEQQGLIKAPNAGEPYWTLRSAEGEVRLLAVDSLRPQGAEHWLIDFLAVVRNIHLELLAGTAGEVVLLVSGVVGLILSVTGLVLWWPGRRGFGWRWFLPWMAKRQLVLRHHRHAGVVVSPLLIVVLLTGTLMYWQKLVTPLLPPVDVIQMSDGAGEITAPSRLLSRAAAAVPDGEVTYIRLPAVSGGVATFRFRLPGEWHPNGRTSVLIDTGTGEVTMTRRADRVSPARFAVNQLYPLHSGYGMPQLYGFLVMASGLYLCWLGLTGALSYFRRR